MITPAHRARTITKQVRTRHQEELIDNNRLYIDNLLQSIDQVIKEQANKGATAARLDIGNVTLGVTNPVDRAELLKYIKQQVEQAGYNVSIQQQSSIHINWDGQAHLEY